MAKVKKNSQAAQNILVGIDEAGRGPLAGPLSLGVFVVPHTDVLKKFRGVRESKQLTEKEREDWFAKILEMRKNGEVSFHVSFAEPSVIDVKGLTFAVNSCIQASLEVLLRSGHLSHLSQIRLDGLLHAPKEFLYQKTIIHGDAREKIIALASICAKVMRDRIMVNFANTYPQYGFEENKGYGTTKHYEALKTYGISRIHRHRFLRSFDMPIYGPVSLLPTLDETQA